MIQRLSHSTVYVLDQDRAKTFYTEKLGLEVKEDATMGSFRWLTVGPKGQDIQMVLMPIAQSPMMDESSVATMRSLVEKGALGGGVFETDDCQATYEKLKAAGVTFRSPPAERPYGVEAILVDDSGNFFSVCQRRR
jgi:predicted enzyme related to lactoylglutathione lyase